MFHHQIPELTASLHSLSTYNIDTVKYVIDTYHHEVNKISIPIHPVMSVFICTLYSVRIYLMLASPFKTKYLQ